MLIIDASSLFRVLDAQFARPIAADQLEGADGGMHVHGEIGDVVFGRHVARQRGLDRGRRAHHQHRVAQRVRVIGRLEAPESLLRQLQLGAFLARDKFGERDAERRFVIDDGRVARMLPEWIKLRAVLISTAT